MTSPTRWTWVCASCKSWWWTGRPGMLQSMGLQRGRHDWVTELNWFLGHWTLSCFSATLIPRQSIHCVKPTELYHQLLVKAIDVFPFYYFQIFMESSKEIPMDRGTWQATVQRVDFPGGSVGRELPCNPRDARDMGLIPGSGRSPGGGHGYSLQYSCLENLMDRGAWWPTVHRLQRVGHDWSEWAQHILPYNDLNIMAMDMTPLPNSSMLQSW